jgi:hemoglobin
MRDLATKEDIAFLVEKFYQSILKNKFLRPFFENINFKEHLPRMIHFWSFILHDEAGYTTNVTEKHILLPLKKVHFEIWLELFNKTTDFYFNGKYADKAKERAALIGWTIQSKIVE